MGWSYMPLWRQLLERKMKKTTLGELAKVFPNTMAKMGRDETVSMDAIGRICQTLGCRIEDVVEYVPDAPESNETVQ